jgi:hypothetical protein
VHGFRVALVHDTAGGSANDEVVADRADAGRRPRRVLGAFALRP